MAKFKRHLSEYNEIRHFILNLGGQIILIPVLLVLVSLGIALFFLQTSALAPFIYTLF